MNPSTFPTTVWDVVLLIQRGKREYGPAPGSPYAKDVGSDHLSQYFGATRASTKSKHAIEHCCAMARFSVSNAEWPLAYDWIVAAISLADSDALAQQLTHFLLHVHVSDSGGAFTSWGDLFAQPPLSFDQRLFAVTSIRLFNVCPTHLARETQSAFVAHIQKSLPDVSATLGVDKVASPLDHIQACRTLLSDLQVRLRPLADAVKAGDIHALCNCQHTVSASLNSKLVAALLSPYLPRGFVKNQIPHLFTSLQGVRSASVLTMPDLSRSCLGLIDAAKDELERCGTFAARYYLLPLFHAARRIAQDYFEKSDATKPATIRVLPYKTKYPFHETGSTSRLTFVAENLGAGPASDVAFTFLFLADLDPEEAPQYLSILEKGTAIIEIPVVIGAITERSIEYCVEVKWKNFDGSYRDNSFGGFLEGQQPDVDWVSLRANGPYNLTAVDEGRKFIGRQADLGRLIRQTGTRDMGSAMIHGQKRVGKTSLAKELARVLSQQRETYDILSIYLEGGDYVEPTPEGTVRRLGKTLCERVRKATPAFTGLALPEFTDSLSPLADYFDRALECDPRKALLLVLDEFDELPLDLYKRGPVGDSFFLTLRSLSGRPRLGIVLVGAEKIRPILNAQGDKLNKWVLLQLDYFNRETHWADFCELVTVPTKGQLEFSDAAIERLYSWCEGNPFFCNVICGEIVDLAIERKDSFVTERDVEEAAAKAIQVTGANSFQHFWDDGILAPGNFVEEVSMRRRRVLIALANQLQRTGKPSIELLRKEGVLAPLSPAALESELKQFVERGVLTMARDVVGCRIKFFEEWLRDRGPQQISVQYLDPDLHEQEQRDEQEARVSSSELMDLVRAWRIYRGKPVEVERIRAWLDQFGTNREQRLMYQLLRGLRFYSQDAIRAKLHEAMGIVKRATVERKLPHGKFRRDLLVVGLGGLAKSGPKTARLFAQENQIFGENVLELAALKKRVDRERGEIQAVVIVDDFIGTGRTTCDQLASVDEAVGDLARSEKVRIFYIAVCGFEAGRIAAERRAQELSLPIVIRLCDTLEERDKAFSDKSSFFLGENQRLRAMQLAKEKGSEVEPERPLGYGDCQALVVFDDNCPNNSLPILWKNGKNWSALFPRFA